MDIGMLQMISGNVDVKTPIGSNLQSTEGEGQAFSSVLGGVMSNAESLINEPSITVETIALTRLLEATSLEEIAETLNVSVEQLQAEVGKMVNGESSEVVPLIANLLVKLDVSLEGTEQLDLSSLLQQIEQNAPQLFAKLTQALQGQTELPKQEAVELLALLKAVSIVAPERDLLMKQEQQLFTIQSYLSTLTDKLEGTTVKASNVLLLLKPEEKPTEVILNNQSNQKGFGDSREQQQTQVFSISQAALSKGEVRAPVLEQNQSRAEALMREMQTIFKRANFGQTGGTNRLLIKLYPEHLGQVRIELLQTNGILTARILASSAQGKEMLDSQLHQLRAAFTQQGLQVERIDITQTLQDATRQERQDAFNEQFKQQGEENDESSTGENDEEEMSFEEHMIELEV